MANQVVRRFITDQASASFDVNEKRDFTIEKITFLTDTNFRTNKTVTVTAKHDGVHASYQKTFSFTGDYTFDLLDEVGFTKDSIITIDFSQVGAAFDKVKIYADVVFIGDILDYVLDATKGAITVTAV